MYALIRKDFIAGRLYLAIGLALYALYIATAFQNPLGFFVVNIGTTMVLILAPIVIEEKYQVDALVCYLPPSRGKVVLARYVMALLALLIGLGLQYGLGTAVTVFSAKTGFETLRAPQAALLFCIVPIALSSIYFPCFFRFGLGRGSFVFVVVMIALAILVTSPIFATGMFSATSGFVLTRESVQHPELALVALIDHIAAAVGELRFYLTVSLSTVALSFASFSLSNQFFQRRDF